jgi:hypothetical protein
MPDEVAIPPTAVRDESITGPLLTQSARGARLKALEAVTQKYTNLFKIPATDLFYLTHERYIQMLSVEIHAQADLARRLSFEMDWVWQHEGR